MPGKIAKTIQTISLIMLAWLVCSFVGRWHWLIVFLLVTCAGLNLAVVWLHSLKPEKLRQLCRFRVVQLYCRCVGACIGETIPGDSIRSRRSGGIHLNSPRDFLHAKVQAKSVVRGHDEIVDALLERIHENLTLRKSRRGGKLDGPLGAFLLCGKEGIGKRYLTRVLSKLLFRGAGVEVFACRRLTAGEFMRSGGVLAKILERDSFTLLLFEGIEGANEELLEVLSRIVTTGVLVDGEGNELSLKNVVVVLTTDQAVDEMAAIRYSETNGAVGRQEKSEIFNRLGLPISLINGLHEILYCEAPSPETSAEVVALVFKKECRDHGIDLCHVDPEILATQVIQIDEAHGFQLVPQRAKHLLRKPLVAAANKNQKTLALRVLPPSPENTTPR